MSGTPSAEAGTLAPEKLDPKKVAELEKLYAKLERLNKEAEQLGAAMRQKPRKD
jgi:hypothetical protein